MSLMQVELAVTAAAAAAFFAGAVVAVRSLVNAEFVHDRVVFGAAAVGGGLLAVALAMRGVHLSALPVFGHQEAASWYALAVCGGFMHLRLKHATRGLGAFLLPFLFLLALCAVSGVRAAPVAPPVPPELRGGWLNFHVITAFLGYGLFTVESVLAMAYLIQDRNLKRKHFGSSFRRLPPLEALDHLMRELIGVAFGVFTVALVLGVVLAHRSHWSAQLFADPKIIATAVTWAVYAVLFQLQTGGRCHGRRVAVVALIGLLCVLFAFAGVHAVAECVHNFMTPSSSLG